VGPEFVVAALGLCGAGVTALWKIANGLGRFEARTTTILSGIQEMLSDHEQRLRDQQQELAELRARR
jgi:ABC-type phosphate/phosphonate transport system ATPase subunit